MKILSKGDTVGIVACSNGLDECKKDEIARLTGVLEEMGLNVKLSDMIFKKYSVYNGTGKERAERLMNFYRDKEVKAVFDISGGDLANEVLEYLDFEQIKSCCKPYFGYSDLTVIINALYRKSQVNSYLYQLRNLCGSFGEEQIRNFKDTFFNGNDSILSFNYQWIQGNHMEGIVLGGNIRCLLKLAGTEYMPDFKDKILFLESFSGDSAKMATALTQYKHLGIFKKVRGIILGSYTEMEKNNYKPDIVELVRSIVDNKDIPIVKTEEIGHGKDSKCMVIGKELKLSR